MACRNGVYPSNPLIGGVDYYPILSSNTSGINITGVDSDLYYQNGSLTTTNLNVTTINGLPPSGFNTSDVKYWGAVGDGITDDTVAIQTAINNNNSYLYFTKGTYLISDTLLVSGKTDFEIESDSAVILLSVDSKPALSLLQSPRCSITGTLRFKATAVFTNPLNCALKVVECDGCNITGVDIDGGFVAGGGQATCRFYIGVNVGLYGGGVGRAVGLFSNLTIKGCQTGIYVSGEYYNFANCQVTYCLYGMQQIIAGNVAVNGGMYNENRIGIYIDSNNTANGDHGKIIGATLNHNRAAGIFIKRTFLSHLITGCDIWANTPTSSFPSGFTPTTLTEATAVSAQGYSYGVYLEDCECITMTGNSISRNIVNVGFDGIVSCNFANNMLLGNPGQTFGNFIEFGKNQSLYNANVNNAWTNNAYSGGLDGGTFGNDPHWARIRFSDDPTTRLNVVSNDLGLVGNAIQIISANGTYKITPNARYIMVDGTKTLTLNLYGAMGGNIFYFCIEAITGTIHLNMLNYTGTAVPVISGTGATYDAANDRVAFTKTGCFTFIPIGTATPLFFIQCPIEAP